MFFSAKEFYNFCSTRPGAVDEVRDYFNLPYNARVTKKQFSKYLGVVKQAIVDRQHTIETDTGDEITISKWYRPWVVVPALRNYEAPLGEYAVGIEIEFGFRSQDASRLVAEHIANWRYVALDYEGGSNPIEATFAPVEYNKFNGNSQASRYLKFLHTNRHLVTQHGLYSMVGTHINVSKGGARPDASRRILANSYMSDLSADQKLKYFGRSTPYAYTRQGDGNYVECKMFNSVTDWKRLRQYVDIAVSICDLIYSSRHISATSVLRALEAGYNKRNKAANVSSPEARSSQALAA